MRIKPLKIVYRDQNLTIEAKAIFTYLFQLVDSEGFIHSPSLNTLTNHLAISENRFRRHRELLIDNGYLISHHQGGQAMTVTYELGERLK